jgi:hypothetical protein
MRRRAQIVAISFFVVGAVGCVSQDIYSGSTAPRYSSPDPYHYLCNRACQRQGG